MSYDWDNLESEVEVPDQAMAARQQGDRIKRLGAAMLTGCFVVLVLGRVFVMLFLPDMVGQGLPPLALLIIIPIWCIGGTGLVLMIVGAVIRWRAKRVGARRP